MELSVCSLIALGICAIWNVDTMPLLLVYGIMKSDMWSIHLLRYLLPRDLGRVLDGTYEFS
jgi:hypothetical protein